MRATIRGAASNSTSSVQVDSDVPVRIYRVPEQTHEVIADKDGEITPLGIRDVSVSREYDDEGNAGYIEFYREDSQLYVKDMGSSSDTVQRNAFAEIDLSDGEPSLITGDCRVEVGYSTELEIEVTEATGPRSPVPVKAELVAEISTVRTANEIQSQLIELRDLMREEPYSGERYQKRLDDIEEALTGIRNLDAAADYDRMLAEENYEKLAQKIRHAAKRVNNYYVTK